MTKRQQSKEGEQMETSPKDRVRSKGKEMHSTAGIQEAIGWCPAWLPPQGNLADKERKELNMKNVSDHMKKLFYAASNS